MSEAIREEIASRMHQSPILDFTAIDENSVSEEEPIPEPMWKTLKSCKFRTTETSALHKVVWRHEVVYITAGQPAIYGDMSILHFISRYLAVMEA